MRLVARFQNAGLVTRTSWIGSRRNYSITLAHPDVEQAMFWAASIQALRDDERSTTMDEVFAAFPNLTPQQIKRRLEEEKVMKIDQFSGTVSIGDDTHNFTYIPENTPNKIASSLIIYGADHDKAMAFLRLLEGVQVPERVKTDDKPARARGAKKPRVAEDDDPRQTSLPGTNGTTAPAAAAANEEEEPPISEQPLLTGTPVEPVAAKLAPPPAQHTGSPDDPKPVALAPPLGAVVDGTIDMAKLANAQNFKAVVDLFHAAGFTDADEVVATCEKLKTAGKIPLFGRVHDIKTRILNQWTASVE